MRNGLKLRSFGVPIERLTVAPAPSACSTASKTLAMPRVLGEVAVREGSLGGMTGRPTNVDEGDIVVWVLVVLVLSVLEMLFEVDRKKDLMYSTARVWL
jgi:hypothetical protein